MQTSIEVKSMNIPNRFWRNVKKTRGCWEWQGYRERFGYGRISPRVFPEYMAHRMSWHLARGPIPKGMLVLHKCDNPGCVRPGHLYLGTQVDNMRDKHRRGRANTAVGNRLPHAKLNPDKVRDIRERLARGERRQEIANRYAVSLGSIDRVAQGTSWRSV